MPSASRNIFWLSVSRITALVLLFLAYRQLFGYLGPHGTGQHQFVLSFVTIFGVIIDFGMQQYIVKKMSVEPERVKEYFHHYLGVSAVLALAVYGALLGVARVSNFEPIVFYAIAVAGSGLIISALTYPFLAVMSAFQDLGKVAFINFLSSLVNIVIIFLTIIFHRYIVFLVLVQPFSAFICLIFYLIFVRRYLPRPEYLKVFSSLNGRVVKQMAKHVLPFALLVGFSTIYNRIDIVIITRLLGYSPAGLYTAAYKFFDLVAFFPAVVSHSLYPMFAGLMARQALGEVKQSLEKYLRFLVAVAVPMAVAGSLLARPMILLLTNDARYLDAAPVLAVLVWAPALLFIYIVANSLVISQLTKFAVIITGANVLINIVGNLILLPRIGIIGAAIMTVASEALQAIFYFYFIRSKLTRFDFFSWWWRPILASLVMGVVVWYVRDYGLFLSVAIGGAVYVAALAVAGFFQRGDLALAKQLLNFKSAGQS